MYQYCKLARVRKIRDSQKKKTTTIAVVTNIGKAFDAEKPPPFQAHT